MFELKKKGGGCEKMKTMFLLSLKLKINECIHNHFAQVLKSAFKMGVNTYS